MNIVDFSEGILGLDRVLPDGRQAREVVAKSLRQFAVKESPEISLSMVSVAVRLEAGSHTDIETIRKIGDKRLHDIHLSCK